MIAIQSAAFSIDALIWKSDPGPPEERPSAPVSMVTFIWHAERLKYAMAAYTT